MAKGDSGRAQNQISYQGGKAQDNLDVMRDKFNANNDVARTNYYDAYNNANNKNQVLGDKYLETFNDIQGNDPYGAARSGYAALANGGSSAGWDPQFRGGLSDAITGYKGFSENGGFDQQAIDDIRARAIAPTRAVYQNMQSELSRNRALQGGYSPNYAAASTKMARNMAQDVGDANVNANASIAQMQQQGKLAGLSGMTGASATGQGIDNQISGMNDSMRAAGLAGMNATESARISALLNSLSGATSQYSATPGMANMAGGQFNQSNNDLTNTQQLQNQLALGLINGQINKAQIPGNYQQALGNIGSTIGLGGQIAGMFTGLPGIGGGAGIPGLPGGSKGPF